MKYSKTYGEFLFEKSSDGWVEAQLTDDAGGLDGGVFVMVHKDTWENTPPNMDIEIYTKKTGYVNVPKNFVEISEKYF